MKISPPMLDHLMKISVTKSLFQNRVSGGLKGVEIQECQKRAKKSRKRAENATFWTHFGKMWGSFGAVFGHVCEFHETAF